MSDKIMSTTQVRKEKLWGSDRLYPLDSLRGLAAFVVAFFVHGQFIATAFNSTQNSFGEYGSIVSGYYPVYIGNVVRMLQGGGMMFVDLFFVLSGFVFAMRYKKTIADKSVSFKQFVVMRVSRLYPAYWVTLVFTVIILILSVVLIGESVLASHAFSYFGGVKFNITDAFKSFIEAVFLLQGFWTMPTVAAYNSPAWSLTFEILAYLLFFTFTLYGKGRTAIYIIPVLFGLYLLEVFPGLVSGGIYRILIGFFSGCILYVLSRKVISERSKNTVMCLSLISIFITLLISYIDVFVLGNNDIQNQNKICALSSITMWVPTVWMILSSKLLSKFLSLRPFRWMGDLSYSIYIWHYPLALIFCLILTTQHIQTTIWHYWLWVGVVIVVSHLSHYYFERPMQQLIRRSIAN